MPLIVSNARNFYRESAGMGGPLNEEEFHVIQGVLDLGRKKAFKAMTPLEKVCAGRPSPAGRCIHAICDAQVTCGHGPGDGMLLQA